jgi:hypothetical protein
MSASPAPLRCERTTVTLAPREMRRFENRPLSDAARATKGSDPMTAILSIENFRSITT